MKLTEAEFQRLKNGDPRLFEKIYKNYKDKVYSFLFIKANSNRDVADDILSDTFYSALLSISKLENKERIQSWLLTIANRRFSDYLRKLYQEEKCKNSINIQEDCSDCVMEKLLENEKVLLFDLAMDRIKPDYKKILKMKYIEKKSQLKIAEVLDKKIVAVQGILYRARESLKNELSKLLES